MTHNHQIFPMVYSALDPLIWQRLSFRNVETTIFGNPFLLFNLSWVSVEETLNFGYPVFLLVRYWPSPSFPLALRRPLLFTSVLPLTMDDGQHSIAFPWNLWIFALDYFTSDSSFFRIILPDYFWTLVWLLFSSNLKIQRWKTHLLVKAHSYWIPTHLQEQRAH